MKVKFIPGKMPSNFEDRIYEVERESVHGEDYVKLLDAYGDLWTFELHEYFDQVKNENWDYDFVTAKAPTAAAAQSFLLQQLRETLPKVFERFEVLSFFSWIEAEQVTKSGIVKAQQPVAVYCLCAGLKVIRLDPAAEKIAMDAINLTQQNGALQKLD